MVEINKLATNQQLRVIKGCILNEMSTEGNFVTYYPASKDTGGLTTYGVTEKNYPGAFNLRHNPEALADFMVGKFVPILKQRGMRSDSDWRGVALETAHIWWGVGNDESCIHNLKNDLIYLQEFWLTRQLPVKGSLRGVSNRFVRSAKRYGYKIDNYLRKFVNIAEIVLFMDPK